MTEIKRRAVSLEQKEKRRQDILNSARSLLASNKDYSALLMKDIAENIGLTKGTLYLYFKTKEEVFIELYAEELAKCSQLIEQNMQALQPPCSSDQVADAISETLIQQPMMVKLASMLHSVLEQNIDYDAALAFKVRLRDHVVAAGELIEYCLPGLSQGKGIEIFMSTHMLVIGYYHASLPSPVMDELNERQDMAFMKVDFVTEFPLAMRRMVLAVSQES